MDEGGRKDDSEELKLLSMAVEQASDDVFITDSRGNMVYANSSTEKLTGYSRGEVMGHNPRLFASGFHGAAFFQQMWETILSGRVWKGHIINKTKKGELFEQATTISPVRDSSGAIVYIAASARDVTREVELEKKYHHAQKMEAIGVLAGGLAHDFNNILSPIIGYTQMALSEIPEGSELSGYLEEIYAASLRAIDRVKQILTFSRWAEQRKESIELHRIVREALKLIRAAIPRTIEICQKVDEKSGCLLGDPGQMHQIIMNLITNAYQAMKGKIGVLTISLDSLYMPETPCVRNTMIPAGEYLRLSISDTGTGIGDEAMKKIFLPFFTTKKEGTGLGLSTVLSLVMAHQGGITVISSPGVGSTFTVYFPRVEEALPDSIKEQKPVPRGDESILVVDDDLPVVHLVSDMLLNLGYRVTSFADSREALAAVRKEPRGFDLVLTDLTMPGLTGDALGRGVREIAPHIPVMIMTGYDEARDQDALHEEGIECVINKPIMWQTLGEKVRECLDGRKPGAA